MANKKAPTKAPKKTAAVPAQNKKTAPKRTVSKQAPAKQEKKPMAKNQSYGFVKAGLWTILTAVLLGIFTYITTTAPVPVYFQTHPRSHKKASQMR